MEKIVAFNTSLGCAIWCKSYNMDATQIRTLVPSVERYCNTLPANNCLNNTSIGCNILLANNCLHDTSIGCRVWCKSRHIDATQSRKLVPWVELYCNTPPVNNCLNDIFVGCVIRCKSHHTDATHIYWCIIVPCAKLFMK